MFVTIHNWNEYLKIAILKMELYLWSQIIYLLTIIYWMFVQISSSPELLEVQKHEWYHVVTNCLSHVFSPSLFTKCCQKSKEAKI